MPVEIELKFRAEGAEPLRLLKTATTIGGARLGRPATFRELDRYLDTPDRRLATAGWACRLRTRADVTRVSLKGPAQRGTAGALHRRAELEGLATHELDPGRWPRSEARDLVESLRANVPLAERFRLLQRRTERDVRVDGVAFGTLTLDVVEVEAAGARLGRLHVVELELRAAATGADEPRLVELGDSLAAIGGLEPDPRTKLAHALALMEER